MRPTFARFDFQDLLDTLPPVMRQPMVVATIGSVFAHALLALSLPVMAGGDQKKPERVVGVVSLTPAEQAKLPSTMANLPGSGMKGTSMVPLPLGSNGTMSPLNGLIGKNSLTGGTNSTTSSGYSNLPGLLDPAPITISSSKNDLSDLWKLPVRSPNSGFKISTTKFEIPPVNLSEDKQVEDRPQRDKTDLPPDERPPAVVPNLNPASPAPNTSGQQQPAEPVQLAKGQTDGTLSDSGPSKSGTTAQPNPQATPSPATPPLQTVAQVFGQATFGPKTQAVNSIALTTAQSDSYADILAQIAHQTNPTSGPDDALEISTTLNPQVIEIPLPLPKTSDTIPEAAQPVAAEFLVLLTPQGQLFTLPTQDKKSTLRSPMLRETGYSNLNQQLATYMETQIPALQQEVTKRIETKQLTKFDKYSYLKIIFKPTPTAVNT